MKRRERKENEKGGVSVKVKIRLGKLFLQTVNRSITHISRRVFLTSNLIKM